MKIAIVGAGRMGSLIGSYLSKGGEDVILLDPWQAHVDAINKDGLWLENEGEESFISHPRAYTSADQVGEIVDLLIVLVMGMYTESATRACLCLCDSHTRCLSLQNGVGNVQVLEKMFDKERLMYGFMPYGGTVLGPGRVLARAGKNAPSHFGPVGFEEPDKFMEDLAALLRKQGLDFHTDKRSYIDSEVWYKIGMNCCGNSITAIARLPLGPVFNCDDITPYLDGIYNEVVAVAAALGITVAHERSGEKMPENHEMYNHLTSTAQDVKAKKQTEIDNLCGAVARMGDELGVPTPYNHFACGLIKLIQANYDKMF